MIRRIIHKINRPNRIISLVSLVLSLASIVSLAIWAVSEFQRERYDLESITNLDFQILVFGIFIICLALAKNALGDLEKLSFDDERITAGANLSDTRYSYKRILDNKCREIIIVGQNMRSLMMQSDFKDRIVELLKNNKHLKIALVFTTPEMLKAMSEHKLLPFAYKHLIDSLTELKDLYQIRLEASEQERLFVYFHPGATSLAATIRDPSDDSRGILTFTVKWLTDSEPQNRMFCSIEKWENRVLFNKLYGHVGNMMRSESASSLKDICIRLKIPW